jgi:hypothetical protein
MKLMQYLLSDVEDSSDNDSTDTSTSISTDTSASISTDTSDSDLSGLTSQPSSPLSIDMSSSPTFGSSSTTGSHVRESSLGSASEVDDLDLLTRLYETFMERQQHLLETRYLNERLRIPHNAQIDLLFWYKEHSPVRFRRKVRVAPDTFNHILSLIETHPIFQSNSIRSQISLHIQLTIFLNRIGHYGNAAGVEDIAEWAGVAPGSVVNCTKRCMVAITAHHDRALALPTAQEKSCSKAWSEHKTIPEWRNGFLAVDGTTIPLFQKPGLHREAWFDRSSRYSMNSQLVILPHNLRIVDYTIGHTGSAHDSYAFQSTRIAENHETFLADGEWMWADSAYPVRIWCVPPYKKPRNGQLSRDQKRFNYHLSSIRVRTEHAISLLKGRFQSLHELRIQIGSHNHHMRAIIWIRCCIILHNLIIQFEGNEDGDVDWRTRCIAAGWHGMDDSQDSNGRDEDPDDDGGNIEDDMPAPAIAREGVTFRAQLQGILLASMYDD